MNTIKTIGLVIPENAPQSDYTFSASMREAIIDFVTPYYAVPGRFYHDMSHIDKMLGLYKHTFGTDPTDRLFFAIVLHDAIWIPGQPVRSEEMSAALIPFVYYQTVRQKIDMRFNDEVNQLIRWTFAKTHILNNREKLAPGSDAERLLDLDLYSMSSPWRHFIQNQYIIDKELTHMATPEERRYGGAMFLDNFAKKGFVFYSKELQHLNAQTIQNIKAYVACIDQGNDLTWDEIAMSDPVALEKLYE